MTLNEELAREDVLRLDKLYDDEMITTEEYFEELDKINEEYGTNF